MLCQFARLVVFLFYYCCLAVALFQSEVHQLQVVKRIALARSNRWIPIYGWAGWQQLLMSSAKATAFIEVFKVLYMYLLVVSLESSFFGWGAYNSKDRKTGLAGVLFFLVCIPSVWPTIGVGVCRASLVALSDSICLFFHFFPLPWRWDSRPFSLCVCGTAPSLWYFSRHSGIGIDLFSGIVSVMIVSWLNSELWC